MKFLALLMLLTVSCAALANPIGTWSGILTTKRILHVKPDLSETSFYQCHMMAPYVGIDVAS